MLAEHLQRALNSRVIIEQARVSTLSVTPWT